MKAAASVTILIVTLFVFNNLVFAQEDHIPRNIERAYEKGTRSLDGSPGPNYWQNSSDYHIKADFNPGKRLLNGSEQIIYHNNSPDTLNSIVLRLYQNLNKATSERNFNISSDLITNGMTIEKLMIDDKEQDLSNTKKFVTTGTGSSPDIP